jgi:GNAT superfamily N-acetyltransferase
MNKITIRLATMQDAQLVNDLIYPLLAELYPNEPIYTAEVLLAITNKLLIAPNYWVFIAFYDDQSVGVIALNQCCAIYALGDFGEITELYVVPGYRSCGVGALLMDAVKTWGRNQGWSMLEVGAPHVPQWQRTVDFYQAQDFTIVGPRLYHLLS